MNAVEPYELHHADVLDVLPTLESESFDAMLTDPPYGLEFMGRDWDRVVPGPQVWREALRVLKPGAFGLVFGGTRTFHRLAVALEDAGFEIRDTLMWVYGSGFPKSHNLKGEWEGYGTALKPAWEPVLLVRKPTALTFAQNALEHECGALNIDGSRVPGSGFAPKERVGAAKLMEARPWQERQEREGRPVITEGHDLGRWPANLIHDGSEEVMAAFPDAPGALRPAEGAARTNGAVYGRFAPGGKDHFPRQDAGSAARFFYTAKADRAERDAGLEAFEPSVLGHNLSSNACERCGRRVMVNGSGVKCECGPDRVTVKRPHTSRNSHPTVKPLALTEYLARLLLPPARDTPRRILTPFAGSGSEMIGALQAGWDETVGIEREAEYVTIADARIAHWVRGIQPRLLEAVS